MAELHGSGTTESGLHTAQVRGVPVHATKHRDPHRRVPVNPLLVAAGVDPTGASMVAPPMYRCGDGPIPPDTAYRLIHDELMLDGNARLNLATFVTTWMEPQAAQLMAECAEKNMIDKDEYPQTAELERRCVAILADLWHAPDPHTAVGCSTTGSSEACMLAGLALKRRWMNKNKDRYKAGARPNLVLGIEVQVCWEKFCEFWEVEPRTCRWRGSASPSTGPRPRPCATRTPSAWWPSSAPRWTAATSRCGRSALARRAAGEDRPRHPGARGRRLRRHGRALHRPRAGLGLPPAARRLDQHLGAQVRARLPGRRLGAVARRRGAAGGAGLPGQLPRRRHADLRAQLLPARRPGRRAVLHLPAARPRGLPAGAAVRPGRGDVHRRRRRRSATSS
jgi:hypothetical protein